MNIKEKIELRQEANILLSKIIQVACDNYKELRYIQILWMLGIIDSNDNIIIDRFSEEPIDTLTRCYKYIYVMLHKFNSDELIAQLNNLIYNEIL